MYRAATLALLLATALYPQTASAQNAENGAQIFRKCRACHDAGPAAKNKVGPQLNGIIGRKAASAAGFNYSEAMTAAGTGGLVWTEDKVAAYIENPSAFIPKNKMAFAGIKDGAERADLIAFLKTLP